MEVAIWDIFTLGKAIRKGFAREKTPPWSQKK